MLAEEDKKRSQSALERRKEKKLRQASTVQMSTTFLEEGYGQTGDEYEQDFVEEDEEEVQMRSKRGRDNVNEEKILEAKQGSAKKKAKDQDDGLLLYDDDDEDLADFIVEDEDDEDVGRGGVIESDSE